MMRSKSLSLLAAAVFGCLGPAIDGVAQIGDVKVPVDVEDGKNQHHQHCDLVEQGPPPGGPAELASRLKRISRDQVLRR
jgi:hypothetical protein